MVDEGDRTRQGRREERRNAPRSIDIRQLIGRAIVGRLMKHSPVDANALCEAVGNEVPKASPVEIWRRLDTMRNAGLVGRLRNSDGIVFYYLRTDK
jgi:hypothetical protein